MSNEDSGAKPQPNTLTVRNYYFQCFNTRILMVTNIFNRERYKAI